MTDELTQKPNDIRVRQLRSQCFDPEDRYKLDFSFKESQADDFWGAHTTIEMLRALDHDKKIELDAKVITSTPDGLTHKQFDRKSFREAFIRGDKAKFNMKEGYDAFARFNNQGYGGGLVGQDFTPLLGGPFFKNLYYWTDYIRMHSECFFAYHNDPVAKAFMSITRDFVIGNGYDIQCDTSDKKGQTAMAVWKAFEEANDLVEQIDQLTVEIGVYGEVMLWWLPGNEAKITYQLRPTDVNPLGIIPRVRLIDPSNIIEIITYPEDITRKLAYIWLTPTQYQIYTTAFDVKAAGMPDQIQPTLKYIYRQIPADQMMHYKINAVSNEKRGRSDFYPILSYLKRLRDSVDYSLITLQKTSAWSIDTTIDGSQEDIDNYIRSMNALGTIPPAGSDFVHTKAVSRNYMGNNASGGGMSNAFEWALSMCCMGVTIPINYLGSHLSNGSTRAGSIVATEPVAKKMQKRQDVIKRILHDLWKRLMKESGLGIVPCQIIFPEIITQDRSQKIKDLSFAEDNRWFKPERVAAMAAKEFGVLDYNYKNEMQAIQKQLPDMPPLLTGAPQQDISTIDKSSNALTGDERRDIKKNGSTL